MEARVQNTCPVDLPFVTNSSCLVTRWRVLDGATVALDESPICSSVITTWNVPTGGQVEATWPIGSYNSGIYSAVATFGDAMQSSASEAFVTQ